LGEKGGRRLVIGEGRGKAGGRRKGESGGGGRPEGLGFSFYIFFLDLIKPVRFGPVQSV